MSSDAYPKVLNTFMAQVYTESTEESCAFSPEEG